MTITSAYNFVPLSSEVFHPDWADDVSYDMPLSEGCSGTLSLIVKSHTPILPGQLRNNVVEHFRLPDDRLAIPGSTLRGMIRSVLEIASFGKMHYVDDRQYSLRDLTPGARQVYGEKFTINHNSAHNHHATQGPFEPITEAGWLFFDSTAGQWKIRPCEFSRVDVPELDRLSAGKWDSFRKSSPSRDRKSGPSAIQKYEWWKNNSDPTAEKQAYDFTVGPRTDHKHSPTNRGLDKFLHYSKATNLLLGQQGRLVFTGQPSKKKHLEFVFHSDSKDSLTVDSSVMRGFRHIYVNTPDTQSDAKKHYEYLKGQAQDGCFSDKGIPVFYLLDGTRISSVGLSLMYKLPYRYSVGETIDHSSTEHRGQNKPDMAELIFGNVTDNVEGKKSADKKSLKGRVSFSIAVTDATYSGESELKAVLNSPKPTYFPNYIEQPQSSNGQLAQGAGYATMMDDDARIRGWKRYPVSDTYRLPPLEEGQTDKVTTRLRPLRESVEYHAKLRFHNLHPDELGALVWCITWGGDSSLRHSLGMAKPFGLGQVSIRINQSNSALIPNNPCHRPPTFMDLQNRFEKFMGSKVSDWKQTDEITQLLAMANPALGDRDSLVAMELNSGRPGLNEFANAKGGHARDRTNLPMFVLTPHAKKGVSAEKMIGEHEQWLNKTIETLMSNNANAKLREIVCGKTLANEWQKLEDDQFKTKAQEQIKERWNDFGGWEGPHQGKSRKAAFKIYTEWNSAND